MRKTTTLKTLAAATLTLLASACAKEQLSDNGGQAGVSFTVEVPGAPATKAIGDGTTAKTLYYQVFDEQGNIISKLGAQTTTFGADGKAKVNFQLVKDQTYNFIFWAQTSAKDANGKDYYTIAVTEEEKDLRTITANYEGKSANDENFDAFFAVEKSLKISGPVTKDITLKRPFAQINIGTKGTISAGTATRPIEFNGAKSTVTVTGVPTMFLPLANADTQFGTPATVTFAAADAPEGNITVNNEPYKYLAMNYVFAPEAGTVTDITATLTVEGKNVPLSVPNAPIKRNWRTNIVGNLLTAEAGFDVVIDPNFDGDEQYDAVAFAFANGGAVTLSEDMTIAESKTLTVAEGKTVVFDLGGHTLTVAGNNFINDGKLTLKNGTIVSNAGLAIAAFVNHGDALVENLNIETKGRAFMNSGADAKLVVNSGTYNSTYNPKDGSPYGSLFRNSENGYLEINGGEYIGIHSVVATIIGGETVINGGKVTRLSSSRSEGDSDTSAYPVYNESKTTINGGEFYANGDDWGCVYNETGGTVTIYGGKFSSSKLLKPSGSDLSALVADGYTTKASFDKNTGVVTYSVVKVTASATDEATLSAALSKAGAVVTLSNDLEVGYISVAKSTTLNLNGATLNCVKAEALRSNKTGVLNITGKGSIVAINASPEEQTSAVSVRNGGTVNIYDGVTLDGGSGSNGNYALRLIQGTANIYGGYFHSGNDKDGVSSEVIYMECGSAPSWRVYLNIYGGVFECDGDAKYLINIQDDYRSKCKVQIYGGTFVGFDPANVNEGTITSFVADGYTSKEITYNGKQAWKVEKE